ncbi:hypothetical protein LUU34_01261300 [Aix galericulata]|nr:hypothetical protein LUU34_01261300 [Aix galericulata]
MDAQGAAGPAFHYHNVPGPCPSALFPTARCKQKKPWKSSSGAEDDRSRQIGSGDYSILQPHFLAVN